MARYLTDEDVFRVLSEYYHHRTDIQRMALSEAISRVLTADVVEKERYDRLLDNALIISEALREYQDAEMLERKKGKWIQRSDTPWYYYCSNCHRVISIASVDQMEKFHAFCGTCGADMREETEDE